jgi:hypothetical protein
MEWKGHMLFQLLLLTALVGQHRHHAKPIELPDPAVQERIMTAKHQADQWAFSIMKRHMPLRTLNLPGGMKNPYAILREQFRHDMRIAGYKQICEAYDISEDQFMAIVRRPPIGVQFTRDPSYLPHGPKPGEIRMVGPNQPQDWWNPTRFDPGSVRLPEKLAKRYDYPNPKPPAKADTFSFKPGRED